MYVIFVRYFGIFVKSLWCKLPVFADCFIMSTLRFHHFGHSFPKRLFRYLQDARQNLLDLVDLPDGCECFLDGYSGLTFNKLNSDPHTYLQRILTRNAQKPIDVLSIDVGTNDLCHPDVTVSVLVDEVIQFLDVLTRFEIRPKFIVFFSVIQRTTITRTGQVSLQCFNHRVKKFNKRLCKVLKPRNPHVAMFSQSAINLPKFIVDGCHLTEEGIKLYSSNLSRLMFKYEPMLHS